MGLSDILIKTIIGVIFLIVVAAVVVYYWDVFYKAYSIVHNTLKAFGTYNP